MNTKFTLFSQKFIEVGLLAIVVIAPLLYNIYLTRSTLVDKIVTVGIIIIAMALAWGIALLDNRSGKDDTQTIAHWLKSPMIWPILMTMGTYVISTLLSINPMGSLWGNYHRLQGSYYIILYMLVFFLTIFSLNQIKQVDRLITVILLTTIPVSLQGVAQLFDLDPIMQANIFLRLEFVENRVMGGLGNPIFLASYLVMIIPLSLMRFLEYVFLLFRKNIESYWHIPLTIIYGLIATLNIITFLLTQSRGPLMGLLIAGFVIGLLVMLEFPRYLHRSHPIWSRLWLGWVGLAIVGATFLLVLNIPNTPLETIRQSSAFSRISNLSITEGSGKLRVLIWQGAIDLTFYDTPLGIPGDTQAVPDTLHAIRPLVGYGPATVQMIYSFAYPAELYHQAYLYKDEKFVDNVHNYTLNQLITYGLLGVFAIYLLIGSIFYYACHGLGWLPDKKSRQRLIGLLVIGPILGWLGVYLISGNETSLALATLGLPLGLIFGLVVYIVWHKIIINIDTPFTSQEIKTRFILIGVLGGIIANFIDVQFSFYHVFTYVYFWLFLGLVVKLPQLDLTQAESSLSATMWRNEIISQSCTIAMMLMIFVLDFLLINQNYGPILAGMIGVTMLIGLLFTLSDSHNAPLSLGRQVSYFVVVPLITLLLYLPSHWMLEKNWGDASVISASLFAANSIFMLYNVFILTLMLIQVLVVIWKPMRHLVLFQAENWWVYVSMVAVAMVIIWFNHINLARADIYHSQSGYALKNKNYVQAFDLLKQAYSLDSGQTEYLFKEHQINALIFVDDKFNENQRRLAYDDSIKTLEEAIAQQPYAAVNYNKLGEYYFNLKKFEEAATLFEKTVQLAPYDLLKYHQLGTTYTVLGNQEKALEVYQKAIERDDRCVMVWLGLGNAYGILGKADEAFEAHLQTINNVDRCGDGLEIFAENHSSFQHYVEFYQQYGYLDELIEAMKTAIAENGESKIKLRALGYTYLIHGEPEQALTYLEQARTLKDNSIETLETMAQTYYALGQTDEALTIYEELLEKYPDKKNIRLAVANVYLEQARYDESAAHYQFLLDKDEADYEAMKGFARLYQAQQQWTEFMSYSYQAIGSMPEAERFTWLQYSLEQLVKGGEAATPVLHEYLDSFIATYQKVEQIPLLLDTLMKGLETDSTSSGLAKAIAQVYQKTGQKDEAIAFFEKAIEQDKDNLIAKKGLGLLYLDEDKLTEAQPFLEEVATSNETDVDVHMGLAYIYAHQGRYEESITQNEAVLEIMPNNYPALINLMVIYQQIGQLDKSLSIAKQALAIAPEAEQPKLKQFIKQLNQ